MPDFRTDTRVTLLHDIPTHHAGEHGTIHDTYNTDRGQWVGVCFDNAPHLIRYVEPIDLAPATHDVADVTKAAEDAVLHIIESAHDMDVPCSKRNCDTPAVWWAEHTACGDTFYVCEPHRASTDQKHTEHIARTGSKLARCVACGRLTTIPVPWRAL